MGSALKGVDISGLDSVGRGFDTSWNMNIWLFSTYVNAYGRIKSYDVHETWYGLHAIGRLSYKVGLGQVPLHVLRFSSVTTIPMLLHIHSCIILGIRKAPVQNTIPQRQSLTRWQRDLATSVCTVFIFRLVSCLLKYIFFFIRSKFYVLKFLLKSDT